MGLAALNAPNRGSEHRRDSNPSQWRQAGRRGNESGLISKEVRMQCTACDGHDVARCFSGFILSLIRIIKAVAVAFPRAAMRQ